MTPCLGLQVLYCPTYCFFVQIYANLDEKHTDWMENRIGGTIDNKDLMLIPVQFCTTSNYRTDRTFFNGNTPE